MPAPSVAAEGELQDCQRKTQLPSKANQQMVLHMLKSLVNVPVDLHNACQQPVGILP